MNKPVEKPYTEIYEKLKKLILKDYGKRCSDFSINCYICQKYLMLDILDECVDDSLEIMLDQIHEK